jgi:hypothetical protein
MEERMFYQSLTSYHKFSKKFIDEKATVIEFEKHMKKKHYKRICKSTKYTKKKVLLNRNYANSIFFSPTKVIKIINISKTRPNHLMKILKMKE